MRVPDAGSQTLDSGARTYDLASPVAEYCMIMPETRPRICKSLVHIDIQTQKSEITCEMSHFTDLALSFIADDLGTPTWPRYCKDLCMLEMTVHVHEQFKHCIIDGLLSSDLSYSNI